jgi:putative DNA primase/helicase
MSTSLKNIPDEFKAAKRWLVLRPNKFPLSAPRTIEDWERSWMSFEDATAALKPGLWLGFAFAGGDWITLDLDNCRIPQNGALHPFAEQLVHDLNTYTEVSISETGLHIIARGKSSHPQRPLYLLLTGGTLPGRNKINDAQPGSFSAQVDFSL